MNYLRNLTIQQNHRIWLSCFALKYSLMVLFALMPRQAFTATWNVTTEAQLRAAIRNAAGGDTIAIQNRTINLTSDLPIIDNNLTIKGIGNAVINGNLHRGLTVFSTDNVPITVNIMNLSVKNTIAKGGNGSFSGGGGAGLGGGLFVSNTATVNLKNVSFDRTRAVGGNGGIGGGGGRGGSSSRGSGGGLAGNEDPDNNRGGDGAFGGGGGGGNRTYGGNGGNGNFGGGGGGSGIPTGVPGKNGFAGGRANADFGGGGAGMGGSVFVMAGGKLNILGSVKWNNGSVAGGAGGGAGAGSGQALGPGVFIGGSRNAGESGLTTLTFNPGANSGMRIDADITDEAANGGNPDNKGALVVNGPGILVVNGQNNYTGGTRVMRGNLQVGDDAHPGASVFGPVAIDPLGILSGHGTINGSVNNSGAISPGGSIGTLTVNGNVTFNPGSRFNVEISPAQSSRLNVTGSAALGNASVNVLAEPGTYRPATYTILNGNPVIGRFSGVNITNAAANPSLRLLIPTLEFFQNRVDLNLEALSDPAGPIVRFPKIQHIGGRLQAPLGEICPENRVGFWARGIGMLSSADASGFAPRYNSDSAGTIVGFDRQFDEHLTLGLAGSYIHTDATIFQRFTNRSSVDSLGLNLYGAFTLAAWQFKGIIGYDNDAYSAQRTLLAVNNTLRQASSKTHANNVNNYSEISYSFKSGNLTLQPLIGLQLGWLHRKGYSERGLNNAGQNLSVNGRTLYSLDTLAGLRTRYELPLQEGLKAQFELRALYGHDFGTRQETVSGRFVGGQNVRLITADRPDLRDAGILGASFSLLNANSLNIYLDYNGEIRSGQQSHFFSAGLRYSW